MENSKEEWRHIPGITEGYMVSNMGRVKSLKRVKVRSNGRPQTIRERILKASPDDWGYPQVRLDRKTYKVHRLVALAFLPPKKPGEEIRHMDGNAANCALSNLAYGTHSENVRDGYRYAGKIKERQKLDPKTAAEIRDLLREGKRAVDIAKAYGVSQQTVCDIKHNRIYREVIA